MIQASDDLSDVEREFMRRVVLQLGYEPREVVDIRIGGVVATLSVFVRGADGFPEQDPNGGLLVIEQSVMLPVDFPLADFRGIEKRHAK